MGGGGRAGYGVDVDVDGELQKLYLQQGRPVGTGSFLPIGREAEVLRALEPLGIPVAHVWGVDTETGLILVDRADGVAWFHPPADPAEQVSVAKDFIPHIATWHKAGARALDLPTFHPVKSVREHQLDQLAGIRSGFEEADARHPIDALARLELELLE